MFFDIKSPSYLSSSSIRPGPLPRYGSKVKYAVFIFREILKINGQTSIKTSFKTQNSFLCGSCKYVKYFFHPPFFVWQLYCIQLLENIGTARNHSFSYLSCIIQFYWVYYQVCPLSLAVPVLSMVNWRKTTRRRRTFMRILDQVVIHITVCSF